MTRQIRYFAPNLDAYVDYVVARLPEFERDTGIKVHVDIIESDDYYSNQIQHKLAGSEPADVFMSGPVLVWQHVGAGLVQPLDEFIAGTDPAWDFNDFFPSLIRSNRWTGRLGDPLGEGPLLEIPVNCESYNLAYRKDLIEQKGIAIPETYDQLLGAAKTATGSFGGRQVYGTIHRGVLVWHTIYTGHATQFWSLGATDFDDRMRCVIDSPAGVEATEYFFRQLRAAGPDQWDTRHWYQLAMDFCDGQYAFLIDSDHYVAYFEDRARSRMAGKVGYALPPMGPAGRRPNLWTWSLVMNSRARDKEAAWQFMQWASGKELLLGSALKGNMNPTRRSSWDNPRFAAELANWGDFGRVSRDLIENHARVLVRPAPNYLELATRWAGALHEIYRKEKSVREALGDARKDIDRLVAP